MRSSIFPLLVTLVAVTRLVSAGDIDQAKAFFDRFVTLSNSFDPAVAELYEDTAKIQNTRLYPTGQKRTITLTGDQYKRLLRTAMPFAKLRGDTNSFSDVHYKDVGKFVRISATRFSNLKKYSSPISLLVGPTESNQVWMIFEEISESRP